MPKRKILKEGDRHKHLVIVKVLDYDNLLCKCDCGKEKVLSHHYFMTRATCGCGLEIRPKKHGLSRTRIYSIWNGMNRRCFSPTTVTYPKYGAKGIKVCDDWAYTNPNGFMNFYQWSQGKYNDSLTIDRIDPCGDYCPENCRWATYAEQNSHHIISDKHRTGYRNVYPTKFNTYTVIMSISDKSYNVGTYKTIEEAVEARNKFIDEHKLPNPKQEYEGKLR